MLKAYDKWATVMMPVHAAETGAVKQTGPRH